MDERGDDQDRGAHGRSGDRSEDDEWHPYEKQRGGHRHEATPDGSRRGQHGTDDRRTPFLFGEVPPAEELSEDFPEDDDELSPVLDTLANLSILGVSLSFVLAVAGLAGLALGLNPYAEAVLAVAIVEGSLAMVLTAFVGTASGMFNPFD